MEILYAIHRPVINISAPSAPLFPLRETPNFAPMQQQSFTPGQALQKIKHNCPIQEKFPQQMKEKTLGKEGETRVGPKPKKEKSIEYV